MRTSALIAALVLVGCGVSETEVVDGTVTTDEGTSELSASSRTYVTIRHDFRRCISPLCGGYWVQDVNRANPHEVYVSGLDYSTSGLTAEQLEQTQSGEGDLVLYGKLGKAESVYNTRQFVVTSAWRGLPGVTAAAGESFYRVEQDPKTCIVAPCAQLKATKLHTTAALPTDGVDVKRALLNRVDGKWLVNRIEEHGALVVGKFVAGQKFSTGTEKILSGSQVFVKVPEVAGPCPVFKLAACPAGKTRTYVRDADRCILPGACVTGGACALFVPQCDSGYSLQSWTGGQFACQVTACDPTWSLPTQP